MTYVATINVPGYLPTDDDPPVFDSADQAWLYLAQYRANDEDESATPLTPYSETVAELEGMAMGEGATERTGTVYGPTPGYDGDHDLGLAYSVDIADD
jgi:hypothetical protein